MYIYKSALRTECEFRLRSYTTNYLQKPDIDLEAVVETKIVIRRLIGERNNAHAWESLFDKACVIALEFEIEVSRPRLFGRQRNSELSRRQPIRLLENIPIPCLLGSFSGRDIKVE